MKKVEVEISKIVRALNVEPDLPLVTALNLLTLLKSTPVSTPLAMQILNLVQKIRTPSPSENFSLEG